MLSLTMDLSVEYSQLATRSLSGLGLSSIVCMGGGKETTVQPINICCFGQDGASDASAVRPGFTQVSENRAEWSVGAGGDTVSRA